ncbi:MAG: tRNA (adenosine(37)-N6)-threonylcarbamoyltransferase complex dimerization subunit type 1 TsaB, partial [Burkholderiales bacterium]|nr:tRNA (adenosine(37)-N6)-threonylcarbamoyltransferase complex dimerization subunit type 1 TsaB [Burkholderiales bacterium]
RLSLPAGALRLPDQADRAGALLRLALRAAQAGAGIDAAAALPLYLRDKVAQTTREREAGQEAGRGAAVPVRAP